MARPSEYTNAPKAGELGTPPRHGGHLFAARRRAAIRSGGDLRRWPGHYGERSLSWRATRSSGAFWIGRACDHESTILRRCRGEPKRYSFMALTKRARPRASSRAKSISNRVTLYGSDMQVSKTTVSLHTT